MNRPSHPHHRICLLFDLDCFYAQCERVRLGLPQDVCLALLQWNAVLAVTYPARKFGIKRGDNWEAVAEKSNSQCWAIHLNILEKEKSTTTPPTMSTVAAVSSSPPRSPPPTTTTRITPIQNPYRISKPEEGPTSPPQIVTTQQSLPQEDDSDTDDGDIGERIPENIEEAYDQIYNLSQEQQLEYQKRERGLRRYYHEGKACLERYRIASVRIFSVVLNSLIHHLGGKDKFVLERASIDEFYLDVTDYCYEVSKLTMADMEHQTVLVGDKETATNVEPDCFSRTLALQRACQVSHLIRRDVFETLGFTMSAGICTNKMMAKLAASYGKPNGQAVLYVSNFPSLLNNTKIKSVRHFGGKLGKQVLKILREQSFEPESFDSSAATMGDLRNVSLPALQKTFSDETASFIFGACRGVDNEAVRETNGALVKSITAFKSFPATSQVEEIHNWMSLMADEIVVRVTKDSARNHRYPKTCSLSFTHYATENGKRPVGVASARSFSRIKSIRLNFPHENKANKKADLVEQSMAKLSLILKQHPLRGVGLAVSNFESRGCPPEGVKGITTFFKRVESSDVNGNQKLDKFSNETETCSRSKEGSDIDYFETHQNQSLLEKPIASQDFQQQETSCIDPTEKDLDKDLDSVKSLPSGMAVEQPTVFKNQMDLDQEMARKLQATFDRENYALNTSDKRFPRISKPPPKKLRTIDSFFGSKR